MKSRQKVSALLLLLCLFSCRKENDDTIPEVVYNLNRITLLNLVNEQRTKGCKCGSTDMPAVPALTWSNVLAAVAYNHSLDMKTRNYFSHTTPEDISAGKRIEAGGYNYTTYGENIARGYGSEEAVVKGWLDSEGHCKNIMGKNYTEIGVGREGTYWTMVLATPKK